MPSCPKCGSEHDNWTGVRIHWQKSHFEEYPDDLPVMSDDTRQAMRESLMKADYVSGADHGKWQGGSGEYPSEFMMIRPEVKQRDSYQCQFCGQTNFLEIHHLDEDKTNNSLDNLLTLCLWCHRSVFH
jgi:hypothetical protein